MDANEIYKSPEANLVNSSVDGISHDESHEISDEFYVVGLFKLAILFSCTLGVYVVYWFYRQWNQQKKVAGIDCSPIARAIFSIFFTHSLFEKVEKKLRIVDVKYNFNSQHVANLFVVLMIASRILDRLALKGTGLPYTDIAGWILIPVIGALLIYVQRLINIACNDVDGTSNSRFTGLNFLWVTIGTILILLVIIGSTLD